jgi:hypothetical protein
MQISRLHSRQEPASWEIARSAHGHPRGCPHQSIRLHIAPIPPSIRKLPFSNYSDGSRAGGFLEIQTESKDKDARSVILGQEFEFLGKEPVSWV